MALEKVGPLREIKVGERYEIILVICGGFCYVGMDGRMDGWMASNIGGEKQPWDDGEGGMENFHCLWLVDIYEENAIAIVGGIRSGLFFCCVKCGGVSIGGSWVLSDWYENFWDGKGIGEEGCSGS